MFEFEGLKMDRCPMLYLDRSTKRFIRAFRFSEKGWLPNRGSVYDQPYTFVEAMECFYAEITKQEKERADESRISGHPKIQG